MIPAFSAGRLAMSVDFFAIEGTAVRGGLDGILPILGILDMFFMTVPLELGWIDFF
jgi:hypothetical protein